MATQPTPVFLPGKFHGQRSLAGYSLWGRKELNMTEHTHRHTHTHTDSHTHRHTNTQTPAVRTGSQEEVEVGADWNTNAEATPSPSHRVAGWQPQPPGKKEGCPWLLRVRKRCQQGCMCCGLRLVLFLTLILSCVPSAVHGEEEPTSRSSGVHHLLTRDRLSLWLRSVPSCLLCHRPVLSYISLPWKLCIHSVSSKCLMLIEDPTY